MSVLDDSGLHSPIVVQALSTGHTEWRQTAISQDASLEEMESEVTPSTDVILSIALGETLQVSGRAWLRQPGDSHREVSTRKLCSRPLSQPELQEPWEAGGLGWNLTSS